MIRDRLVCSITDKRISKRLQLEAQLTLETAIINMVKEIKIIKLFPKKNHLAVGIAETIKFIGTALNVQQTIKLV